MIREMTASEKVFCNKLRARGLKIDIYTSHEAAQYIDHYDFVVNGQQVEFKEMKSVNRNGSKQCDRQAVEHQAVHSPTGERNRLGWIHGTAKWIVFEEPDGYLWVLRAELEQLVADVDWHSFTTDGDYSQDYKAFRRITNGDDRDDLFCYVQRADIIALSGTKKMLDNAAASA